MSGDVFARRRSTAIPPVDRLVSDESPRVRLQDGRGATVAYSVRTEVPGLREFRILIDGESRWRYVYDRDVTIVDVGAGYGPVAP